MIHPVQEERRIKIHPFPKQEVAWGYLLDDKTSEIGYGGAGNGGKTWIESEYLLSQSLHYPDTAWLLGRKDLTDLKKTTVQTFFRVCAHYGLKNAIDYRYHQQDNAIYFPNKSVIWLMELKYKPSDPLNSFLGSYDLTGACVDESTEVPYTVIDTLSTRVGRRNNDKYGLFPKVLEAFNPDKGHVYARYYEPWKNCSLPDHRAFIRALPTDNPYTPKTYLDQLRRRNKVTMERLLFGNFEYDEDPAALIEYPGILDSFVRRVDGTMSSITADIARLGQDKTVIFVWRGLQIIAIHVLEKKRTTEVSAYIVQLERTHGVRRSHVVIDEDGVGGGVVDQLPGCYGFVNGSKPIPIKGDSTNYLNLRSQCYFELARRMNDGDIGISTEDVDHKTLIIQELEQVKQKDIDKDGKLAIIPKERVKEVLGRSPDFADAMMMRMALELKSTARPLILT